MIIQSLGSLECPLRVGSSYWRLQEAKFRYPPESGYTIGLIFSDAYSCFRPEVELRATPQLPHQQSLTLQVAGIALSNGLSEILAGRCFNPAKPRTGYTGGTPKALDQGHCASLCVGIGVTDFVGQMCGNGAVDDAWHLGHDFGLTGKQKA